MNKKLIIAPLAALALALIACSFFGGSGTSSQANGDVGPHRITGSFDYTNSIITDYYVEHAVALVDMYGFVQRDMEWEIPVDSQTLGFVDIDTDAMHGTYSLNLPEQPTGENADVDNDGNTDTGVQIYAVAYWPNLYGGPYSEGDDPSRGWPSYLASVITNTENKDEVLGGKLVVWAPDGDQQFPTAFGADGLLFTADDPVGPIPAGYSIVDLDSETFTVSQDAETSLELYEPQDVAIKDFSGDTYTDAFDKMVELLKNEYAFNGIVGKAPGWDSLYAQISPMVQAAEDNNDPNAFYVALRDFSRAFKDGHVGLDAANFDDEDFTKSTGYGYGMTLRELNDGRVLVIFLGEDSPAADAGIKLAAEITSFNGVPIGDAISSATTFTIDSSDFSHRYQQLRYLIRTGGADEAEFTYANPGGTKKTVTLTAIQETESHSQSSIFHNANQDPMLPVEFKILDSGVGYVVVNSNYDDLGLIIKLFERALQTFEAYQVPGIIIDLRYNTGGANLGLAGFLTENEIPMGQLEYYSEASGQFEPEGLPDVVLPYQAQYRFDTMVMLVGQACFSACELEAYGFSQVPGMIVVGETPTSGTEGEVARGQFILPEGFVMQFPTGRFTLPDGSIFLEGVGVPPTIVVPVDETTVFSEDDVALQTAEDLITGQ